MQRTFSLMEKTLFSSHLNNKKRRDFNLYSVDISGYNIERIIFFDGLNGFPILNPSGKHPVFTSNRNQKRIGNTHLFPT